MYTTAPQNSKGSFWRPSAKYATMPSSNLLTWVYSLQGKHITEQPLYFILSSCGSPERNGSSWQEPCPVWVQSWTNTLTGFSVLNSLLRLNLLTRRRLSRGHLRLYEKVCCAAQADLVLWGHCSCHSPLSIWYSHRLPRLAWNNLLGCVKNVLLWTSMLTNYPTAHTQRPRYLHRLQHPHHLNPAGPEQLSVTSSSRWLTPVLFHQTWIPCQRNHYSF